MQLLLHVDFKYTNPFGGLAPDVSLSGDGLEAARGPLFGGYTEGVLDPLGRRGGHQLGGQHLAARPDRDHPSLGHQRVHRGADWAAGHDARHGTHLPFQQLHVVIVICHTKHCETLRACPLPISYITVVS